MNTVYTVPPEGTIMDVEKLFSYTDVIPDVTVKKFIEEIERGSYSDASSFIDRFGYKLPIDFMSTGCKAAIAIHLNPDRIVSCHELGYNAVSAILKYCDNVQIVLHDQGYALNTMGSIKNAPVTYCGYVFPSYIDFAKYMNEWWPCNPVDLEDGEE